jgi:hypothetical protein
MSSPQVDPNAGRPLPQTPSEQERPVNKKAGAFDAGLNLGGAVNRAQAVRKKQLTSSVEVNTAEAGYSARDWKREET